MEFNEKENAIMYVRSKDIIRWKIENETLGKCWRKIYNQVQVNRTLEHEVRKILETYHLPTLNTVSKSTERLKIITKCEKIVRNHIANKIRAMKRSNMRKSVKKVVEQIKEDKN